VQSILNTFNSIEIYIILGLAAIVIILFILVIILFNSLSRMENRYRKFMRGVNNKNLEELIISYLDKVDSAKNNTEYLKEKYKTLEDRISGCIQKFSLIRYRAFEDVGSDLSFSIALLDNNNDGVIVTGIFGRNESTTYAKPIDKGLSRYDLSQEEIHVLQDAISKKPS
jgi:hypothetical protein